MKRNKKNYPSKLCKLRCGAQARYVFEILKTLKFRGQIFVIDPIGKKTQSIDNLKIRRIIKINDIVQFFKKNKIKHFIVAISANSLKSALITALTKKDYKLQSVISPFAIISSTAKIEDGCIINPLAVIGPNCSIGRGCIIHSLVNIDHDCQIGQLSNLAPGVILAGRVNIGEQVFIYTGAKIIPDVKVGNFAVVGAGECVIKDVRPKTTVVGVPASEIDIL